MGNKFNVGDVVRLKSSDKFKMTVVTLHLIDQYGNEVIECAWTVDGEVKRERFPEEALTIINDN